MSNRTLDLATFFALSVVGCLSIGYMVTHPPSSYVASDTATNISDKPSIMCNGINVRDTIADNYKEALRAEGTTMLTLDSPSIALPDYDAGLQQISNMRSRQKEINKWAATLKDSCIKNAYQTISDLASSEMSGEEDYYLSEKKEHDESEILEKLPKPPVAKLGDGR